MLNNIAFALERLDPKAFFPAVQTLVTHKQAVIRLNAAFVLGDVKRPEGLSMLEAALGDASDFVRSSAIVAIGKLNEAKAIASLEKYANDPNPGIKSEAIYAIVKLSQGKRKDLIYDRLFASQQAQLPEFQGMRQRAAVTLGELGDTRVRDYLLACFELDQCKLDKVRSFVESDKDARTAGRLLLNWVRGRAELVDLMGQLKPAGSVAISQSSFDEAMAHSRIDDAATSATLMGDLGDQSARLRLSGVSKHRDTWLRLQSGVARLRLGDTSATPELMRDFDNLADDWLGGAVDVFVRVGEPAARSALTPEFERRSKATDLESAMASAAVLLAWDAEKRFFRFLDGLSASSTEERELSEYYLRDNRSEALTWVMRRALAREQRPYTRDRLRTLLDSRG
jgi:HEAT repeat protein